MTRTILVVGVALLVGACDSHKSDKALVIDGPFVAQPPSNSPVAPESGGTFVIPNHGPARVCPREGC